MVLMPEVRAFWEHEFLDETGSFDARFTGAPGAAAFAIEGAEVASDAAVLGAGLTVMLPETLRVPGNMSLFADYDARLGSGQTEHAASGGLMVRW
jgi:outer membrane autotransporter protein